MADNSKDIKSLIKLRQQRPSFSRMISWEIGQCDNPQPAKKSKKKKQDSTVANNGMVDENIDDIAAMDSDLADSSEYETANEDTDLDSAPNTGAMTNSETFKFDDLCLVADEIEGENVIDVDDENDDDDDDDDDELMMSCKSGSSVTANSNGEHHQERRRRPSKKQKRKRKLHFKVTYLDELYHLGNLHDPVDNIEDVFTEVSESGIDVTVQCRVPTLVELCLIASRRRRHRSNSTKRKSSQNQTEGSAQEAVQSQQVDSVPNQQALKLTLPIGLKKILAGRHQGKSEVQNQLSFFLNKVLPVIEKSLTDDGYYQKYLKSYLDDMASFSPGVNSVWNELPFPWWNAAHYASEYGSEKNTAFLFSASMCLGPDATDQFGDRFECAYVCLRPVSISAMSALANTMDLMLPGEVNTTAIIRVKRALGFRYKLLVDRHFEGVLPYVLWCRGLVYKATDCFKSLIEKSKEYKVKSMYLSEIAKMHAMFGDTKTAVQFYRLASETANEIQGGNQERATNELSEQEHILLASLHDIGLLGKDKSYQSNSYWSYVISRPNAKTVSVMAGIDSYLCYHLYNWNESKMYDEAIQKLEMVAKTHDTFIYQLSMLYALQGREDVSTKLYKQCRFGFLGAPADLIVSYMGKKARNPWQPVLDHVNKQKSAISPLRVIWRTNLQSPRLVQDMRSSESQFSNENLDLRLNEMGHLTGNMQMLLPPIRNVALDPFTGSVIVDRYSNTGMWTSAYFDPKFYHSQKLMVPTPILVYAGDNGTTVELVNPTVCMQTNCTRSGYLYWDKRTDKPPCPVMLYWRDCNGQVAKLNVFTIVKNRIKENVLNSVKKNPDKYSSGAYALLKEELEMLFQIIDKAADKNYSLTINNIDSIARSIIRERKQKEKKKPDGKKHGKKNIMRHYPDLDFQYIDVQLEREPFVFGHTVLLHLRIEGSDKRNMCMFVNTSNKNTFVQPRLVEIKDETIMYDSCRQNHSDEEFMKIATCDRRLCIYNENGDMVDSFENSVACGSDDNLLDFLIMDQVLFGITKERNSIWKKLVGCQDEFGLDSSPLDFSVEDFIQWSIESISELWQELVRDSNNPPQLLNMNFIGKNFGQGIGKLLMLNLGAGLAFLDPQTLEFILIKVPEIYSKHHEFTSNGLLMKGNFETCKILAEKNYVSGNSLTTLTVIGVQHKLFILETVHEAGDRTVKLSMVYSLILPGIAKDFCFVGKQVGMLVSLTQQTDDDQRYREHVFQYDWNGRLCGVLPCLHRGSRSFCVQYFHDNEDTEAGTQCLTGWHVYMKDGRDGILCVQLNQ